MSKTYVPRRTTIGFLAARFFMSETEVLKHLKELETHDYIWIEGHEHTRDITIHICAVDPKPSFNHASN